MNEHSLPQGDSDGVEAKHPPINSIEDIIVFKLSQLVVVQEHIGLRWSDHLFGISINEWRLLALMRSYAPVRASDLAERMLMDKSQLSQVVKSLIAKGLATSKPDHEDARAIALSTTAKGQALYLEVIEVVMQGNEQILSPLSALEVQFFNSMLDKLLVHNRALLAAPPD